MRWAEKRRADEQKTRRVIFLKHEDMKNRKNPSALFCPQDKLVENNPAREIPPEPPLLARKRACKTMNFLGSTKPCLVPLKAISGKNSLSWINSLHGKEVTYFLPRPRFFDICRGSTRLTSCQREIKAFCFGVATKVNVVKRETESCMYTFAVRSDVQRPVWATWE